MIIRHEADGGNQFLICGVSRSEECPALDPLRDVVPELRVQCWKHVMARVVDEGHDLGECSRRDGFDGPFLVWRCRRRKRGARRR